MVVIVGEDDANPNEAVVVAVTKDPCSISRRSTNDDNFALAPRADDDDDRRENPRVVVVVVVAANARGTPTQAAVATTC